MRSFTTLARLNVCHLKSLRPGNVTYNDLMNFVDLNLSESYLASHLPSIMAGSGVEAVFEGDGYWPLRGGKGFGLI